MPPLVFKPLGRENVLVNPFTVSKHQALTFISGGNADSNSFSIASAIDFSDPNSFSPNTAVTNSDGTFQGLLFKSVEHIFYTSGVLSGSSDFAAGGTGIRNFPLSGNAYIVNIPQTKFGEGIRPGTFQMADPNVLSTSSIVDDGQGKLVLSGTDIVLGNIFYDVGIAVVKRKSLISPLSLPLISWYDASQITGSNSASITVMQDFSGNNHPWTYTGGNRPILDIVGGHQYAQVTGSSCNLVATAYGLAQPYTMFFSLRVLNTINAILFYNNSFPNYVQFNGFGSMIAKLGGTIGTGAIFSIGENVVITIIANGASSVIRVSNGGSLVQQSVGNIGAINPTTVALGDPVGGGGNFSGSDIGETLIVSGVITGTTMTDVEDYLFARWS